MCLAKDVIICCAVLCFAVFCCVCFARQGGGKAEPTVLALGVDGGFRTDEQKYDIVKTHRLVVFKGGSTEGFSVAYPDEVIAHALLLPCCCLALCVGIGLFLWHRGVVGDIASTKYCATVARMLHPSHYWYGLYCMYCYIVRPVCVSGGYCSCTANVGVH